jgi:hypothetical protein
VRSLCSGSLVLPMYSSLYFTRHTPQKVTDTLFQCPDQAAAGTAASVKVLFKSSNCFCCSSEFRSTPMYARGSVL